MFQFVYEAMPLNIKMGNSSGNYRLKDALNNDDDVKMRIDLIEGLCFLDHYYRHLYRIIKYIDDANYMIEGNKKYDYAAIIRATLSPYELVMIFYNGFSHPKFKSQIEKYALLNNLRCNMLASAEDREMYAKKFETTYDYEDDEKRDMTLEYRKGAFVRRR